MDELVRQLCTERDRKKIYKAISELKKLNPQLLSFLHILCLESQSPITKVILDCIYEISGIDTFKGTMTLTFGDVAESHVGMELIGDMAEHGFSLEDLTKASNYFKKNGYESIIIHLNKYLPSTSKDKDEQKFLDLAKTNPEYQAYVLVVRNGLEGLTKYNKKELATELLLYEWDTKILNEKKAIHAKKTGKSVETAIQNKTARHNLNFDDKGRPSNFSEGKGTTISFSDVAIIKEIRKNLRGIFGENANQLKCEGNKYYEPNGTGIGYHGDSERRKVIGVRIGRKMNLHYMWYFNDRPRGYNISFDLYPGDIYCMSEKSVGTDWKANLKKGWNKKRYTLRHAAGAPEYTSKTVKIKLEGETRDNEHSFIKLQNIYYKKKAGENEKKTCTKTDWELMYN